MPDLLTGFALAALVLTIGALASGLVDRAPLSFPMIFLGLGILLGEGVFNVIAIEPHDAALEAVATLTLALVLFLDALKLRFDEVGKDWLIPVLALGPGTFLTVAGIALAGYFLLDLSPVYALLIGAILSSTDPVVLRDVVRDERIPRSVRNALSVEAGTNDIVVLPTVLILIAVAQAETGGVGGWLVFLLRLFLLGPLAGALVGGFGAWAMGQVDRRIGVRREFQSLYGIGLVLAAYVVGVQIGGDGFLAAFAAGVSVAYFNHWLCDCFLEYGEVSSEMAMLLAFVLFGAVLSTMFDLVPLAATLVFALLVIGVVRPLAIGVVLRWSKLSRSGRALIGWFGPRGLNSLLLVLLAIHADIAAAEELMAAVGLVVIVSVVLHGASATPLASWYREKVETETLAEERESTAAGLFRDVGDGREPPRVSVDELAALLAGPEPPIVLDARSRSQYAADQDQIPGSLRVLPDQVLAWAERVRPDRPIIVYCT